MPHLSPFWTAAARLGGRIDLSPLLDAGGPVSDWPSQSAATLRRAGLSDRHARLLAAATQPLVTPDPSITLASGAYPPLLRGTPTAPPVLFWRGDLGLLERPCVAIVGARRCTGDGARMARRLSRGVADAGGVVVSGLAHGIDQHAHGAAPHATVAVVGQALDRSFSSAQRRCLDRIVDAGGLVLSEFLPGTPAARHTFPRRNRVIAGLALATVVVEAGERSGSLITARHAAAFGREVLAVPGHPLCGVATGCLRLLRQGAMIAENIGDIAAAVPRLKTRARAVTARSSDPLLSSLAQGDRSFDQLLDAVGLDPAQLAEALARHELAGRICACPGDRYRLAPLPTDHVGG